MHADISPTLRAEGRPGVRNRGLGLLISMWPFSDHLQALDAWRVPLEVSP